MVSGLQLTDCSPFNLLLVVWRLQFVPSSHEERFKQALHFLYMNIKAPKTKPLTQFDVSVQHEEDVPGLQVSVDDLHAVEVHQSLQHLAAYYLNLWLRQPTIQL